MKSSIKVIEISDDGKTKPVLRLPFVGIENAFIIVSFGTESISASHLMLDYYREKANYKDKPFLTFFYAGQDVGAEWEPQHGPIMMYTKCKKDWIGESCGNVIKAKEHWFYDYVENQPAAWSQLAVDDERLKDKLTQGQFVGIFAVLKAWTRP